MQKKLYNTIVILGVLTLLLLVGGLTISSVFIAKEIALEKKMEQAKQAERQYQNNDYIGQHYYGVSAYVLKYYNYVTHEWGVAEVIDYHKVDDILRKWDNGLTCGYMGIILTFCIMLCITSVKRSPMRIWSIGSIVLWCIGLGLGLCDIFEFDLIMLTFVPIGLSLIYFLRHNKPQLVSLIIACITLPIIVLISVESDYRMIPMLVSIAWTLIPLTQAIFFFVFAKMFKPQHN